MAWVNVNPIFVESVAIFNMCTLDASFPGQKAETAGINVVIIILILIIIIVILIMMMIIMILIILIIKWC